MHYLGTASETTELSQFLSKANYSYHSNPSLCPTTNAEEAEVEWFYEDLQGLLELIPKNEKHLFIIGDWNAKGRSQEILE